MSISRSRPEACAHSDHCSGFLSPLAISHRARLNIERTITTQLLLTILSRLPYNSRWPARLKLRILHIFGEMLHKSIFLLFVVQPVLKCLVVQLAMFESCSWGHFISTSPCNTWTIVVCSLSLRKEFRIGKNCFSKIDGILSCARKSRLKAAFISVSVCRLGQMTTETFTERSAMKILNFL